MADQAEIGGVAGAGKPRKQREGVFISYARRDGKHFAGKLRDRFERKSVLAGRISSAWRVGATG